MDMEAFQEKMDPAHRSFFCRMLRMKELPECLLEQYARIKLLTDRIDGFLTVGELALVAVIAGFNPDTGKFVIPIPVEETTEGIDRRLQAQADELAVKDKETAIAADEASETDEAIVDKPVGQDEAVEQAEKEVVEKTAAPVEASTMTGEQAAEAVASGAAKPVETEPPLETNVAASDKIWSLGMPVSVLQADDLKEGKIVSILPPEPGSDKAVQLTVEFDDQETVTVDEDEVEAV